MRLRAFAVAAALGLALPASVPAAAQTRLADGEVTRAGPFTAYLINPTTRYAHGVLGDAIEAGGFVVERAGRKLIYRLGEDAVFEDRRVRLLDLDGDGQPEAVIVKSYLQRGAALAVYRIRSDRIVPLAESAAFGVPHRWLNPIGAADFTGSGETMLAAVLTPHLSGSLRLYRLVRGTLSEAARFQGVTNHIVGSRNLDLAAIADIDGDGTPEIVLPTLDRLALAAVGFRGGKGTIVARVAVPKRIVALNAVKGGRAAVTLEDGSQATVELAGR